MENIEVFMSQIWLGLNVFSPLSFLSLSSLRLSSLSVYQPGTGLVKTFQNIFSSISLSFRGNAYLFLVDTAVTDS